MSLLKRIAVVLLSVLFAFQLTGCGEQTVAEYEKPKTFSMPESGVIAQNERYSLLWDSTECCVLMQDLQSGFVWSTVPYDFYSTGDTSSSLNSPMFIKYYDPEMGVVEECKAYSSCIENDLVSAQTVENGIQLYFYFEEAEISVPLTFVLRNNSLEVSVDTSLIKESGLTQLVSVSVAPYLCSAPNSNNTDSYLFVPVGSGALMYTDEELIGISRVFSTEMYGTDKGRYLLEEDGNEQAALVPVCGVKNGENALCAVIEEGSGSALVEAEAGNYRNGYSTVYSTFCIRGYDETEARQLTSGNALYNYSEIYAEDFNHNQKFSVGYYPLSGADACYEGMAKLYRDYLTEKGLLEKDSAQQPFRLELLGGATVKTTVLGLPTKVFKAATTFKQANTIIEELTSEIDDAVPEVMLKGFGKSGIDVGELGGGFKFAGKLGTATQQTLLETTCSEKEIRLYTDFDIIRYNKSGKGFSIVFDTAKTANLRSVLDYPQKINIPADDTDTSKVGILARSSLEKAVKKLEKFAENRISGISLGTLGEIAYSDYRESEYYAKGQIDEQIQELIRQINSEGHAVSVRGGNSYAAAVSDSVYDVPLSDGNYDILDESVPFYQMVFRGSTALYSEPVNLTSEPAITVLTALSFGVSPSFTLCHTYDESFAAQGKPEFYGSVFDSNKEYVINTVKETVGAYKAIGNSELVGYTVIKDGVTQSRFGNGVILIVNKTDSTVICGGNTIEPRSFIFGTDENHMNGGGQIEEK